MGAKGFLGIDTVMANLNTEIRKVKNRSKKGLIEASIVIRRDMDKRPPKIPVGDTGNLRASWFTTMGSVVPTPGGGFKGAESGDMIGQHSTVVSSASGKAKAAPFPVLIMGFSAGYSVFVHEMMGSINWNRPGSGGLFFESSMKRNAGTVLRIIQKNAKIR